MLFRLRKHNCFISRSSSTFNFSQAETPPSQRELQQSHSTNSFTVITSDSDIETDNILYTCTSTLFNEIRILTLNYVIIFGY